MNPHKHWEQPFFFNVYACWARSVQVQTVKFVFFHGWTLQVSRQAKEVANVNGRLRALWTGLQEGELAELTLELANFTK